MFAFSNSPIRAQNLVPNGGFEDIISCPTNGSQLDHTEFWTTPDAGTPDYYHGCAIAVPQSNGTQAAHRGRISGLGSGPGGYGGEVHRPPAAHFAMHVSLADNCQVTTDAIGVAFSDTAIANLPGGVPLPLAQQVSNPSGVFLPDTGWLEVSGDFIAAGGEEYFTSATFNDYGHPRSRPRGSYLFAYTYLDDVSGAVARSSVRDAIGSLTYWPQPVHRTAISVGSGLMGNCPLRGWTHAEHLSMKRGSMAALSSGKMGNWGTGLWIDLTLPTGPAHEEIP
ncbi:MAG: hypothetical protein IPI55_18145 [Flavobacteriales bacterium]|nr:hypothetical protein [Flavobacteriales bacterium]